jgi:hypothetical protein
MYSINAFNRITSHIFDNQLKSFTSDKIRREVSGVTLKSTQCVLCELRKRGLIKMTHRKNGRIVYQIGKEIEEMKKPTMLKTTGFKAVDLLYSFLRERQIKTFTTADLKRLVPEMNFGTMKSLIPELRERGNIEFIGFDSKSHLYSVVGVSQEVVPQKPVSPAAIQNRGGKEIIDEILDLLSELEKLVK